MNFLINQDFFFLFYVTLMNIFFLLFYYYYYRKLNFNLKNIKTKNIYKAY